MTPLAAGCSRQNFSSHRPSSKPGRFHGSQPSLTDLDAGDLKVTTDFRDVYATLLRDVLDTDPAPILPGWSSHLTGVLD